MTNSQSADTITKSIAALEVAIADVDEAIEQLQTAQPPSAEGRDAQRRAIEQARARVAVLRSRVRHGHGGGVELAEALATLDGLEASMLPDEEAEARYESLCRTREELAAQMQAAHAELGKARHAELTADLRRLGAERAKAEQAAELARIAEADARDALYDRLAPQWPALATRARAELAAEPRPEPAEHAPTPAARVFADYLRLLDSIQAAQGTVPMVVNGANTAELFRWNADLIAAILSKGVGTFDSHWLAKIRTVRDAMKGSRL